MRRLVRVRQFARAGSGDGQRPGDSSVGCLIFGLLVGTRAVVLPIITVIQLGSAVRESGYAVTHVHRRKWDCAARISSSSRVLASPGQKTTRATNVEHGREAATMMAELAPDSVEAVLRFVIFRCRKGGFRSRAYDAIRICDSCQIGGRQRRVRGDI